MSTLAFFPWLQLNQRLDAGPFQLRPYRRGRAPASPGSADQAACDVLLEMYRTAPQAPVRNATVLQVAGRGLTEQLDEPTIRRVFIWGELVAFSGLSGRHFFDDGRYANREAFQLIVQNFADPASGVAVERRRRDGSATAFVSHSAAIFQRPLHVELGPQAKPDAVLLTALLTRSEQPDWGRYQEAIQLFNAASTDDPMVLEESELVSIAGAFERLFDLSRGKEDDLAAAFVATLASEHTRAPASSARVMRAANPNRYLQRASMREVWIRDLFQLRHQHAHGKIQPHMTTLWSRREHLLLASVAFPLVVKRQLEADGCYALSRDDHVQLAAFEALLEPEHFRVWDGRDFSPYPWSAIMDREATRVLVEELVTKFEARDLNGSNADAPRGESPDA